MYKAYDKKAAIIEIQNYLSEIYTNEDLYRSGVFDKKTGELIIRFQSENDLPTTGIVNFETHKKLYKTHKKIKQNNLVKNHHSKGIVFPIKEGVFHDDMTEINRNLKSILDKFGIHHNLRIKPVFSSATADAVIKLRKTMKLEDKEEIDEELLYRIITELKNT